MKIVDVKAMEPKIEKQEKANGLKGVKQMDRKFDVLVIGAGAAGLMGAWEIALTGRKVAVIEAIGRIGGRIFTHLQEQHTVELGAEFVHGDLPLTQMLLKNAGIRTNKVSGSIWQYKDGELQQQEGFIENDDHLEKKFAQLSADKSVAAFLDEDLGGNLYEQLRFSLRNYVEGYYAADTAKASVKALCEELANAGQDQYRIEGGYRLLVDYLTHECQREGVIFCINEPVLEVRWERDNVTVITETHAYNSRKILVTVPVGVLQQEVISFCPALPQMTAGAKGLGFGHVIKLVLRFKKPFWQNSQFTNGQDLRSLSFLFSGEAIPTWWAPFPKNDAVLTGWLGGPAAEKLRHLPAAELQTKALASISRFFTADVLQLQHQLVSFHFHNWSADRWFRGAYSYDVVGGAEIIQNLLQPVEGTLFFAGEGLHSGPQMGTVEGALQSGREAARRLIQHF